MELANLILVIKLIYIRESLSIVLFYVLLMVCVKLSHINVELLKNYRLHS